LATALPDIAVLRRFDAGDQDVAGSQEVDLVGGRFRERRVACRGCGGARQPSRKRGEAEVWGLGLSLSTGVEKRLRRGMVWYRVNVNLAGSVPTAPNTVL
jgi:hypothetical protein